jgi:hypothetical protein
MATTTKRAAKGGEVGANGEFYEGGKFINTNPDNAKKLGSRKAKPYKCEVAPYKWEYAPEGKGSLYEMFQGAWGVVRRDGVAVLAYGNDQERLDQVLSYSGFTRETAQAWLDRFNAGEKWRDLAKCGN